jgi:hypothetical protein
VSVCTYAGQSEVAECTDARTRVEEEIGGLDIAVDDTSGVYIVQSAEHATEILFDGGEGEDPVVVLAVQEAQYA